MLRDGLLSPRREAKPHCLNEFFKNGVFEGRWLAIMLKWRFINSGDSGSSSSVKQEQEVPLSRMNLGGSDLGPLIDEFSMNVAGMSLKEVFFNKV